MKLRFWWFFIPLAAAWGLVGWEVGGDINKDSAFRKCLKEAKGEQQRINDCISKFGRLR